MRDVLKVDIKTSCYIDLCESAGHVWLNREFVMICERIKSIFRDENGRLHSEDGMALQYRDGWGLYMWHGVKVNAQTILFPETITSEQADKETNGEVRRIMIERMGPGKYLKETNAKVLDMDALTIPGSAPRALMEDKAGMKWLCGTDGSTKRVYFMPVPREAMTCTQAHNAIAAFDEARLIQEA
jgi:hypothetical protein